MKKRERKYIAKKKARKEISWYRKSKPNDGILESIKKVPLVYESNVTMKDIEDWIEQMDKSRKPYPAVSQKTIDLLAKHSK